MDFRAYFLLWYNQRIIVSHIRFWLPFGKICLERRVEKSSLLLEINVYGQIPLATILFCISSCLTLWKRRESYCTSIYMPMAISCNSCFLVLEINVSQRCQYARVEYSTCISLLALFSTAKIVKMRDNSKFFPCFLRKNLNFLCFVWTHSRFLRTKARKCASVCMWVYFRQ